MRAPRRLSSQPFHVLEREVASVRHRIRTLIMLRGLSRVVGYIVGLILILALADYLLRFQGPGLRLFASLGALATLFWTVHRYLYVPSARVPSDVDIARWIERRLPRLGNRLSSSMEFLRQAEDDPEAGSVSMRRTVIARCTDDVGSLELRRVVDFRPAAWPVAWAAAVCAVTAVVATLDIPSARVALARLANPLDPVPWPRTNHLVLRKAPTCVALGEAFEVELVDAHGPLPSEVRIHYRCRTDGRPDGYTEPMRLADGVMVARKENVRRPFEYRAEGGDDDTMAWNHVEVVHPPRIESLRITLFPPSYTGWAPVRSDPRIHALSGTRVEIHGTVTKPLRRAMLEMDDGRRIPARLSGDGRQLTVAKDDLVIEASGVYGFILEGTDHIVGGRQQRWEILADTDRPPRVEIERPDADVFVTPETTVSVAIVVQDDLAVREVALVGTRSDSTGREDLVVPIYTGPSLAPAAEDDASVGRPRRGETEVLTQPNRDREGRLGVGSNGVRGSHRMALQHAWDLRPLDLAPGAQIVFHARAGDYRPQTGKSSAPRRIHIVTADEFDRRVTERQRRLLNKLEQAMALQREVRGQSAAAHQRMRAAHAIDQEDLDRLQATELNQRQVSQALTGSVDCVAGRAACLLADVADSRTDRPAIERRMRGLVSELELLETHHLPVIRRELTAAWKAARARQQAPRSESDVSDVADRLAEAGRHQQRVMDGLEGLARDLSQWLGYHRYRREIDQVRRDQVRIEESTKRLARLTLTYEPKELTEQQRADLERVAADQVALARRLDAIEQGMQATSDELREHDQAAAATLADAVLAARQLAISGRMRETGYAIERNQVGQAAARQERIVRDLVEILARLAGRGQADWQHLVETVCDVAERQGALLDETVRLEDQRVGLDRLTGDPSRAVRRLARDQGSLKDETDSLADTMRRTRVFERALRKAAQAMGRGARRLAKEQTGAPTQRALADAGKRLTQMLDALRGGDVPEQKGPSSSASGQAGTGGRSADESPEIAELKLLKSMQEAVNHKTRTLENAFTNGKATEDQQRELERLAAEQGELADLVTEFGAARAGEEE